MRLLTVHSLKNQAVIADKCFVAERFFPRFKGLLGRAGLAPGEGLLIRPCNDIHMWFMRFPIDVVFVKPLRPGADGRTVYEVTSAHRSVRPWRPLPLADFRARETFELPVGTIDRCSIVPGDQLCTS